MRRIGTIFLALSLLLSGISSTHASSNTPIRISGTILGELSDRLEIQATTSDPLYSQQWYFSRLKIPSAWNITTGSSSVIAVVDTGVNANHVELAGRLWSNTDEIAGNGQDDDRNGFVDDYQGYNFVNKNNDISDDHGHGTGVASIIAANTNNGAGIAGVDRRAKIMVVKALDTAGGGEYGNVIKATRYAVDNGANIINMSFGAASPDDELRDVVNYAISRNVIIVAASGNAGQDFVYYPAAYSSVIAVGSIGRNDSASSFSNTGSKLDVVAPGEDIVMASRQSGYSEASGSSFSAALVSGIVALLLSVSPGLTPAQVSDLLHTTSDHIGSTTPSSKYGYGVPDAYALVNRPRANLRASYALPTPVPANGIDIANVSATITANNIPQPNISVTAQLTGGGNIINGQATNSLVVGTTNSEGKVSFQLSSVVAEVKQLNLSTTEGTFESASASLTFSQPISPSYQMQWLGQSPYANLALGESEDFELTIKNTGNIAWVASPSATTDAGHMRLGTDRPMDRSSIFYDQTKWISPNRVVAMSPSIVRPGETAKFNFTILAPNQPGSYKEYFRPVIERVSWLNDLGIYWEINVGVGSGSSVSTSPASYQAQLITQSGDINLSPGATAMLTAEFKNSGTATWSPTGDFGRVKLGTWDPADRNSKFTNSTWLSPNRVKDTTTAIAPGDTLRMNFTVTAPTAPGRYTETFHLVSEFLTWFGPQVTWNINVS